MQLAIAPELNDLAGLYREAGYGIRFVGGCVRDALLGQKPKDFDLATTATPEEQIALAQRHRLRHLELGLAHGTVGIVLNGEVYEITTLRRERDHDGRHATCEWTTDWTADAGRRDLRINAMSIDFSGRLHDPFGGYRDLQDKRVRFVGDAAERIDEDYLRGLRFLRFHGRIAGDAPLDGEGERALHDKRAGLANLSVERIRAEIEKIIAGPHAEAMMAHVARLDLKEPLGIPEMGDSHLTRAIRNGVTDPHERIAAYLGYDADAIEAIGARWKLSGDARTRMMFVATHRQETGSDEAERRYKRLLTLDRSPHDHVRALGRAEGQGAVLQRLEEWTVPRPPVGGDDLIRLGYRPGPTLGRQVKALAEAWSASDYTLAKADLLKTLAPAPARARSDGPER